MTGDIMTYAHKDIYYLDTSAKAQSSEEMVNLFMSPAGRELMKYKPKAKTKYKTNPAAVDLFAQQTGITPQSASMDSMSPVMGSCQEQGKTMLKNGGNGGRETPPPGSIGDAPSVASVETPPRRSSLDLYNEAAAILGLSCSQTNDCRCLECQVHYFDFDDDLDFTESYTDHQSMCSIQ